MGCGASRAQAQAAAEPGQDRGQIAGETTKESGPHHPKQAAPSPLLAAAAAATSAKPGTSVASKHISNVVRPGAVGSLVHAVTVCEHKSLDDGAMARDADDGSQAGGGAVAQGISAVLDAATGALEYLSDEWVDGVLEAARDLPLVGAAVSLAGLLIKKGKQIKVNARNCERLREVLGCVFGMLAHADRSKLSLPGVKQPVKLLEKNLVDARRLIEGFEDKSWFQMLLLETSFQAKFQQVHESLSVTMQMVTTAMSLAPMSTASMPDASGYTNEMELAAQCIINATRQSDIRSAVQSLLSRGREGAEELADYLPLDDPSIVINQLDDMQAILSEMSIKLDSLQAAVGELGSEAKQHTVAICQVATNVQALLSHIKQASVRFPELMKGWLKRWWQDEFERHLCIERVVRGTLLQDEFDGNKDDRVQWTNFKQSLQLKYPADVKLCEQAMQKQAVAHGLPLGEEPVFLDKVLCIMLDMDNDGHITPNELCALQEQCVQWALAHSSKMESVQDMLQLVADNCPRHVLDSKVMEDLARLRMKLNLEGVVDAYGEDQLAAEYMPGTRLWLFERAQTWMQDSTASRLFVLMATAGMGKTVASMRLISQSQGRIHAYHLFKVGTRRASTHAAVLSLAYQLVLRGPTTVASMVKAALDSVDDATSISLQQLFDRVLLEPLQKVDKDTSEKQQVMILLDALDEAEPATTSWSSHPFISLLTNKLPLLPSWVRFIVTTRPEVKSALCSCQADWVSICQDGNDNQEDLHQFIRHTIQTLVLECDLDAAAKLLLGKSQGIFIYMKLARPELASHNRQWTLQELQQLPTGLDAVYQDVLQRISTAMQADVMQTVLQLLSGKILPVLCAARQPLTVEELVWVVGAEHQDEVMLLLMLLATLFPQRPNPKGQQIVVPYHKSVLDFLLRSAPPAWRVTEQQVQAAHKLFADRIRAGAEGLVLTKWDAAVLLQHEYMAHHIVHHMVQAEEWSSLCQLLLDARVLRVMVDAGHTYQLLYDVADLCHNQQLHKAVTQAEVSSLHFLHRFLMLAAQQLAQTPQLLLQEVLNAPTSFSAAVLKSLPSLSSLPEAQGSTSPPFWYGVLKVLPRPASEFGALMSTVQLPFKVLAAHYSPNGELFAAFGEGQWCMISSKTGQVMFTSTGYERRFSGDASAFTVKHTDSIEVVSTTACQVKCKVSAENLEQHLLSHGGQLLVLCAVIEPVGMSEAGEDSQEVQHSRIRVVDTETGMETCTWQHPGRVKLQCLSKDSKLAVGAAGESVVIWEVESGRVYSQLEGVKSAQITPDGTKLVGCTTCSQTLRVWDLADKMLLYEITLCHKSGLQFVAGTNFIACSFLGCSWEQCAEVYSTSSGKLLFSKSESGLKCHVSTDCVRVIRIGGQSWAWATDGQFTIHAAKVTADGIETLDIPTTGMLAGCGKPGEEFRHCCQGRYLVWRPDGLTLREAAKAGTSRMLVTHVIDTTTGTNILQLPYCSGAYIDVHPNGKQALCSSREGQEGLVEAWALDAPTSNAEQQPAGNQGVFSSIILGWALSYDGSLLATCSRQGVWAIWDMHTCRQLCCGDVCPSFLQRDRGRYDLAVVDKPAALALCCTWRMREDVYWDESTESHLVVMQFASTKDSWHQTSCQQEEAFKQSKGSRIQLNFVTDKARLGLVMVDADSVRLLDITGNGDWRTLHSSSESHVDVFATGIGEGVVSIITSDRYTSCFGLWSFPQDQWVLHIRNKGIDGSWINSLSVGFNTHVLEARDDNGPLIQLSMLRCPAHTSTSPHIDTYYDSKDVMLSVCLKVHPSPSADLTRVHMSVDPSGQRALFTEGPNHSIWFVDQTATGASIKWQHLPMPTNSVSRCAFNRDGTLLAAETAAGIVLTKVQDLLTATPVKRSVAYSGSSSPVWRLVRVGPEVPVPVGACPEEHPRYTQPK